MSEEKSLLKVLEAYRAAVLARDVDGLIELYDDDVRIFDLWGRWQYESAEEWRDAVEDWLGSHPGDRLMVDADDVQVLVSGEMATLSGFLTCKGVSAEGKELRRMDNRVTWVLQKQRSTWRIVHEHTSAPVDSETRQVSYLRPAE